MNTATAAQATRAQSPLAAWNRLADRITGLLGDALIALVARFGIAGVFFLSGRTKVDGLLSVRDSTYAPFADEYKLLLLSPEFAAHLASYAEHLFPLLLVLGLCTRLSALALLGMTATIQIFVYPDAWATHRSWVALLVYLVARGGGNWSFDRALGVS